MAGMQNVTIENCDLVLRNFSGKEGRFNPAGARNFAIVLTDQQAEEMQELGWNVKYFKPRDDEPIGQPFIKVKVGFDKKPPKILLVTTRGKTYLDEQTVHELDHADIETCDVTLNPFEWSNDSGSGVTAYAKTIVVKVVEDYLEMKWDALIESWDSQRRALPAGSSDDDYIDATYYETHELEGA